MIQSREVKHPNLEGNALLSEGRSNLIFQEVFALKQVNILKRFLVQNLNRPLLQA